MDLVESIPKDLDPHIRGELQPGELLIILLSADIRPDGQYGDSWFALTDERILVFHPNGSDKPETLRLNLDEVLKVQTRNYVGSGALVVELEDETVELLRFSQSAFYKFSSVPQAIEAAGLVKEEDQADHRRRQSQSLLKEDVEEGKGESHGCAPAHADCTKSKKGAKGKSNGRIQLFFRVS